MKPTHILVAMLILALPCAAETIRFDTEAPGATPTGWAVAMTNQGGPPKWEIVSDVSAPSKPRVLAQVSTDATRGRFPLAVHDGARIRNGKISVRFKTISGSVDQAAGIVWRYQDPNNYYVVRANALEDNVVLYKVEKGKRVAIAPKGTPPKTYGVKHRVPGQTWCLLGVTFRGGVFTVRFDGRKLFEVEDTTFSEAGAVGLWTKADSVTYFDDFAFSGN
jgi:hypothetical protein